MRRVAWLSGLVLGFLFLAGCGGGGSNTTQQLRVVMASPDAPRVDILIDGTSVATSLAYTNSTAYLPVKTGNRQIEAVAVSDSKSIFQQKVAVAASGNQTIIVIGPAAKTEGIVLTDGNTSSTSVTTGDGSVRVVNASTTMGAADIYIVNAGTGLAGKTPVATGVGFGQSTTYQLTPIGDFEVFLTAPGTTSAFVDTGSIDLTQSQYKTIIALDGANGGFNYLVLTDQ